MIPVPRHRPARPRLVQGGPESLESRRLMAVYTVNSTADLLAPPAGVVTLRSAIQAANASPGADTINVAVSGTYKVTTIGPGGDNSAGEFDILTSGGGLTIQGAPGTAVDGGGLNSVFVVNTGTSTAPVVVSFRGLTITGGFASTGGGIDVVGSGAANVVLDHASVVGNVAGVGAGVAIQSNAATLVVVGGEITDNTAFGKGGGIYAPGSLLAISGSVIRHNAALDGAGGGVLVGGTAVSLTGDIVDDNTADGDGGGLDAAAGTAALSVTRCFFLDNVAAGNGGGIASGRSTTGLADDTLQGNVAGNDGGGLDVSGNGGANVVGSEVVKNSAFESGGGIATAGSASLLAVDDTVADNRAYGFGGGIAQTGDTGSTSLIGVLVRGNATFYQFGGGFFSQGGLFSVTGSRISGNAANIGGGGYVTSTALTITDSTLDSNRASIRSGGLEIYVSTATIADTTIVGNAAGVDGGLYIAGDDTTPITLLGDTIDGNSAAAGAGGIYQDAETLVTMEDTIVALNTVAGAASDDVIPTGTFGGTLNDKGGNLLGSAAGSGNKFGAGTIIADPKLGPLVDNGGQDAGAPSDRQVVPTQAPLPGSPAFGKGVAGSGVPVVDERGFARPIRFAIGAYEPQYASNASANQVFVEDLFEVLFNHVADPYSLAGDTAFLNGEGTPTALAQILQGTAEFLGDEATLVTRRYLGRTPSASELKGLVAYLQSGHTPEQLEAIFVGSDEFFQDYSSSNDVFLQATYQTALGRAASTNEIAAWDQALTGGLSRPSAASIFLSSQEYLTDVISSDFGAYLGRPAQPSEVATFLSAASMGATTPFFEAVLLAASFGPRA